MAKSSLGMARTHLHARARMRSCMSALYACTTTRANTYTQKRCTRLSTNSLNIIYPNPKCCVCPPGVPCAAYLSSTRLSGTYLSWYPLPQPSTTFLTLASPSQPQPDLPKPSLPFPIKPFSSQHSLINSTPSLTYLLLPQQRRPRNSSSPRLRLLHPCSTTVGAAAALHRSLHATATVLAARLFCCCRAACLLRCPASPPGAASRPYPIALCQVATPLSFAHRRAGRAACRSSRCPRCNRCRVQRTQQLHQPRVRKGRRHDAGGGAALQAPHLHCLVAAQTQCIHPATVRACCGPCRPATACTCLHPTYCKTTAASSHPGCS